MCTINGIYDVFGLLYVCNTNTDNGLKCSTQSLAYRNGLITIETMSLAPHLCSDGTCAPCCLGGCSWWIAQNHDYLVRAEGDEVRTRGQRTEDNGVDAVVGVGATITFHGHTQLASIRCCNVWQSGLEGEFILSLDIEYQLIGLQIIDITNFQSQGFIIHTCHHHLLVTHLVAYSHHLPIKCKGVGHGGSGIIVHIGFITPYAHFHIVSSVVDRVAVGINGITLFVESPDIVDVGGSEIIDKVLKSLPSEYALRRITVAVDGHLPQF